MADNQQADLNMLDMVTQGTTPDAQFVNTGVKLAARIAPVLRQAQNDVQFAGKVWHAVLTTALTGLHIEK